MDTKRESPRQLGTELLQDLAAKLAQLAQESLGVGSAKAKSFADAAVSSIADDWGGQKIYIPMDLGSLRSQRNMKIYKEFNGDNVPDLVTKYRLSAQQIYRIVKAIRRELAPRQGSLLPSIDG